MYTNSAREGRRDRTCVEYINYIQSMIRSISPSIYPARPQVTSVAYGGKKKHATYTLIKGLGYLQQQGRRSSKKKKKDRLNIYNK